MASIPNINSLPHTINLVQDEISSISVTASVTDGGTLSYLWYVSNTNAYNGTSIASAISSTFDIPTTAEGTKYYYCLVTNTLNGDSVGAYSPIVEINVKTTQNYIISLINNKNLLVQELNAKGVEANINETYDTLIPKVNLIIPQLPVASAQTLGGIKVGNNLSIDSNGVLSADAESYELPIASSYTLGGIKVGENLTITSSGVLNAETGNNIIECTKEEYLEWEADDLLLENTLYVITDVDYDIDQLIEDSHTHNNKELLDSLTATGESNEFLAADGQYHEIEVDTSASNGKMITETEFDFWNNDYIIKDENGDEINYDIGDIINFSPTDDWNTAVWKNPDEYVKKICVLSSNYTADLEDSYNVELTQNIYYANRALAMITYTDPNRSNEVVYYIIPPNCDSEFQGILGPFYSGIYGYDGDYKTASSGGNYIITGYNNGTTNTGALYYILINASTGAIAKTKTSVGLNAYESQYSIMATKSSGYAITGPNITSKASSSSNYTQYYVNIYCDSSLSSIVQTSRYSTGISCSSYIKSISQSNFGGLSSSFGYYFNDASNNLYFGSAGVYKESSSWSNYGTGAYPRTINFYDKHSYISTQNNKLYYIEVYNSKTVRGPYEIPTFNNYVYGYNPSFPSACGAHISEGDIAVIFLKNSNLWYYTKGMKNFIENRAAINFNYSFDFVSLAYDEEEVGYIPLFKKSWTSGKSKDEYMVVLDPEVMKLYYYKDYNLLGWDDDHFYMNKNIYLVAPMNPNIDGSVPTESSTEMYLGIIPRFNFNCKINGITVNKPISASERYQLVCELNENNQKVFTIINRKVKHAKS